MGEIQSNRFAKQADVSRLLRKVSSRKSRRGSGLLSFGSASSGNGLYLGKLDSLVKSALSFWRLVIEWSYNEKQTLLWEESYRKHEKEGNGLGNEIISSRYVGRSEFGSYS